MKNTLRSLFLALTTVFLSASATLAATLTPATGGNAISADTAGGAYTSLTGPAYQEGALGDVGTGTIVLNAPSGFQFDTGGTAPTVRVNGDGNANKNINNTANNGTIAVTVTSSNLTITITTSSGSAGTPNTLTWQNVRVRPTAGTPLASGNITKSGTANMVGVTNNTSNFGTLTEISGAASQLAFIQQPTTTNAGAVISPSVTVRLRDTFGNNAASNGVSVAMSLSGTGTLSGTTTRSTDASGLATFNDLNVNLTGSKQLIASSAPLNSATSSVFTINVAAANVVRIETAADGSGSLVSAQTNATSSASPLTVYAITRDASGNFIANAAADSWTMVNTSGGVANSNLVAAGDSKSAVFTGHCAGSGQIRATISGLTSVDSGVLTVVDDTAPSITCPSNIVVNADVGQCNRSNVTFLATATDNCDVAGIVSEPASGSTFPVGVTTVTNTATDIHGNASVCTFTVTVNDVENPEISCPSNIVANADAGQCSKSNVTFLVSATDNCGIASIVSEPASGSTFAVGTTTVTNTATDIHGNVSVCTFTVTVNDTENPVITCPSNIVLSADAGICGKSNVTFLATATDNCGVASIVSEPASGSTFAVGTTTVTNTATDIHGNVNVCTFTVTVNDTESTAITCPSNIVANADAGQCSKSNVTFLVSATDNCDVAGIVSEPASGSTFPVGVTTVTNTATDIHGNASVCTFTVTVNDVENPEISCPSNIVANADAGQCSKSNVTFIVGATDNCGVASIVSEPASGSTFAVGTTTVTNTATNIHGNVNVCTFTVTVNDTENPAITCPSNIVANADAGQCSKSNVTFLVSATDNCDVAGIVSEPASGSAFSVGTTTVTNTATDIHGNVSVCTFTVTVNDTENPAISCPSNIVANADAGQCSKSNVTFIVSAADNCDIASVISEPASGSAFSVGTTTVTNTATDIHGNVSVCTFTVTVNDTENPVITCPSNIVISADIGACSKSNVTFIVSAADNCDIASVISEPASGSAFSVGTTTVTNTATDIHGNVSVCTFTVTVNDTENPVITCPSNIVISADIGACSKSNVTFLATATDNCGVASIVSVPASGSTFAVGTTTVTNTATDIHGNVSVCTFTVTVNDNENPSITCPSDIVKTECSRSNMTFLVTATDNCGIASIVSVPASGSTFPVGVTIVTNTATDIHGNASICTFTVTITGVPATPVLDIKRQGTNVVVSWESCAALVLEEKNDLNPAAIWTTTSAPIIVNDSQNTATVPVNLTNNVKLFRLRSP